MPSIRLLNAATTAVDPGAGATLTDGLGAVLRTTGVDVEGLRVSVGCCEGALAGRGRAGVDEFVFWETVVTEIAKTR